MLRRACYLLLLGVLLSSWLLSVVGQFPAVTTLEEDCPFAPECCEEDCCGQGSSWDVDTKYCIPDADSTGFNGTYSDAWEPGCIMRTCCEAKCCQSDLEYDEETANCITVSTSTGRKGIGSECENDSQCSTGSCYFSGSSLNGTSGSGTCACNLKTGDGCDDGFVCATPFTEALNFMPGPECFLPYGAPCDPQDNMRLTRVCNEATGLCGCSSFLPPLNYPCDFNKGESCILDKDGNHVCGVPESGDGLIGSECDDDSQCSSNSCYFSVLSVDGSSGNGTCTCNTETGVGCDDGFVCYALFIEAGPPSEPDCYLPYGAPCDPEKNLCVTRVCNMASGLCGCSSSFLPPFDFPCDLENGERCLLENDNYVCKVPETGNGVIGSECVEDKDCENGSCDYPGTSGLNITGPDVSGVCSCNVATRFGCDSANDERCVRDADGDLVCAVPDVGDGSIGSTCYDNSDCPSTNSCFVSGQLPLGSSGTCTCNLESGDGCDSGFVCATPFTEAINLVPGPECFLPYGAPCDPQENMCLTDVCNEASGLCGCSRFLPPVNFPCDFNKGEFCILDNDGNYVCGVPESSDGLIGSECSDNSDCESGSCFTSGLSPPGSLGTCTCNPSTGDGCDGDFVCTDSDEILEKRGVADSGPVCYLPVGTTCDPEKSDCLTGNCDGVTNVCACSTLTNYPCQNEEVCLLGSGGSYVCEAPMSGDGSIGSACFFDDDCDSGSCYRDPEIPKDVPGFCVCDPATNNGCEGKFICASSSEIEAAQFIADASPKCYLLVGTHCDNSDFCLSGNCDEGTSLCTCSTISQYGCDKDGGKICVFENGASFCKLPRNEPIGNFCINDSDCVTRTCYYGFIPSGSPGTCTCNTETNAGCDEGEFFCASSSDLTEAQVRTPSVVMFLPSSSCFTPICVLSLCG